VVVVLSQVCISFIPVLQWDVSIVCIPWYCNGMHRISYYGIAMVCIPFPTILSQWYSYNFIPLVSNGMQLQYHCLCITIVYIGIGISFSYHFITMQWYAKEITMPMHTIGMHMKWYFLCIELHTISWYCNGMHRQWYFHCIRWQRYYNFMQFYVKEIPLPMHTIVIP
jgi:hypothetical protein